MAAPNFHLAAALVLTLLTAQSAIAETRPGEVVRKKVKAKKSAPEKRHDPTELDRLLMPAPNFAATAAPVGGLLVSDAFWDPHRPQAEKFYAVNGGSAQGLQIGDRLLVSRGQRRTIVAEVEVVALTEESARIRVVRRPDPLKVLPLAVEAVLEGDRVSLLLRAPAGIWPKPKVRKRRPRRVIRKTPESEVGVKAAQAALPPGNDVIIIGGRELPRGSASKGVPLTPAQLPEVLK